MFKTWQIGYLSNRKSKFGGLAIPPKFSTANMSFVLCNISLCVQQGELAIYYNSKLYSLCSSTHFTCTRPDVVTGADPGFSEGGVRIRDGSRREELTIVLYL